MTAAETVGPKSVSQPKEKKAKSVSFSLPDGADTAASPVGEHPEVLADSLAEAEPPLLQIMNDEVVEKIPHSTSVFSENADIQLDHKSARSEVDFYLLCTVCIYPLSKISAIIIHVLYVVRI